ncbi:hypothetical protein P7K49_031027 [Saguinus oedipus]|uniref:Uncharacterized protein n=1 Tax=Saguinus oedipus TaxID=9490 RepID=A0ABQ9U3U6_SAGOE|nr:hypothetical protein P7K49_031027 [Saguinus oedipus]
MEKPYQLVDAGWIGFWSIVGGCIVGIAMARPLLKVLLGSNNPLRWYQPIRKDWVCRFYQRYAETNPSPPVFWSYTVIHMVHPDLFEQHHTPTFNHR